MQTLPRPAVQTKVLFDATRKLPPAIRRRLARFGLGIAAEAGQWVHDASLGIWNPTLWTNGPRVEPLPQSDREVKAFESGWSLGFRGVAASRIQAFIGWTDGEIRSFWLGHARGLADVDRLEAQDELDRMYDAMYTERDYEAPYGYE